MALLSVDARALAHRDDREACARAVALSRPQGAPWPRRCSSPEAEWRRGLRVEARRETFQFVPEPRDGCSHIFVIRLLVRNAKQVSRRVGPQWVKLVGVASSPLQPPIKTARVRFLASSPGLEHCRNERSQLLSSPPTVGEPLHPLPATQLDPTAAFLLSANLPLLRLASFPFRCREPLFLQSDTLA